MDPQPATPSGRPLKPLHLWWRHPSRVHRGWETRIIANLGVEWDDDAQWQLSRDRIARVLRSTNLYADRTVDALDGFRELVDDMADAEDIVELNAALDWLYDWLDAERVLLTIRRDPPEQAAEVAL